MTSDPSDPAPESPEGPRAAYDLRPLSTGEVLDRTFQIYRSRFALFASLAALPAGFQFLGGAVQALTEHTEQVVRYGRTVTVTTHPMTASIIAIVTSLVFFVVYGITQAASTWAVAELYLGKTACLRTAWRTAIADWFRYVRVVLRQYWSIFWLPVILLIAAFAIPGIGRKFTAGGVILWGFIAVVLGLGAVIYAIYAALRVSLAVPAAVIESLKANAAVRRSIALLPERKVRIFLLGLLVIAISLVVGLALSPLQILAVRSHGTERHVLEMLQLTGTFLTSALVGPVGAIALCLFYFDERVRHEGFDIEFLMQRAGEAADGAVKPVAEGSQSPELA